MYRAFIHELNKKGVTIIRTIDISHLPYKENRGYPNALLLAIPLSPEYIRHQSKNDIVDHSEFGLKEHLADELAEWVADYLITHGYQAFAQSERNMIQGCFDVDTKTSLLPHKKIAVMAGLGWIGKNNLLVTDEYGCALCLSTLFN